MMRPSHRETASRSMGILTVSRSPSLRNGTRKSYCQFCARKGQTAAAALNCLECCSFITCQELAISGSACCASNPPVGGRIWQIRCDELQRRVGSLHAFRCQQILKLASEHQPNALCWFVPPTLSASELAISLRSRFRAVHSLHPFPSIARRLFFDGPGRRGATDCHCR
jgi:hypothetical protein